MLADIPSIRDVIIKNLLDIPSIRDVIIKNLLESNKELSKKVVAMEGCCYGRQGTSIRKTKNYRRRLLLWKVVAMEGCCYGRLLLWKVVAMEDRVLQLEK